MKRPKASPPAGGAPQETGVIRKGWAGRLRIGLAFPQSYRLAMSNLGFQTVYRLFNLSDDVVCERFCLPAERTARMVSLESGRAPADFDVIAFSVAFENDYPHVLGMLDRGRIPLLAADRQTAHPLVVIGGIAAMLNPEPLSPFADLMLLGEAEAILPRFLDELRGEPDRRRFLARALHAIPGAYVPACYTATGGPEGRVTGFIPAPDAPPTVPLARAADIAQVDTSSTVLTPATTFADTCLIEVSRGCPHGCRFCSAGFVYRPPRFRDPAFLETVIRRAALQTTRVGLVGAAVSDYPGLSTICRRFANDDLRLSFSSLRADALSEDLLQVLVQNQTKTATIAPEAGSQRMRDVINKGLREEDILGATEMIVRAGIPNLRLYFMVGLPTETGDDIQAIVTLCRRIKSVFLESSRRQNRIGTLTVSTNAFIPKPATPFQWAGMAPVPVLQAKVGALRRGLQAMANVRFQMEHIRDSHVQAVLARGDRRIADLLLQHHLLGGNWGQTFKQSAIAVDPYATRPRERDELLPWDFIDTGVRRGFLWQEYEKALAGRTTSSCPPDGCTRCGACLA